MALGDVTFFQEAKAYMVDGGFEAADDIKVALITSGTVPAAGDTTPTLSDYTEVTPGGNYSAGGTSIGTYGNCISQAAGAAKFAAATSPTTWLQNASNPTNASYGLVYHVTTGQAFAFVDLAGPFNMTTGDLVLTWPAGGFATW